MAFGGGGNGQWVRTRTQAGAKSFLAEMDLDRRRRAANQRRARRRARELGASLVSGLKKLFHRP